MNRSEKEMQNSFVLGILYLETEISEVCSACEKMFHHYTEFLQIL